MSRLNVTDPEFASRQLERWCIERNRKELKAGIRKLLKKHPGSRRLLNRSLDWLMRSGQFKEALSLALPRSQVEAKAVKSPLDLGNERALYWLSAIGRLSGWPWVARWLPEIAGKVGRHPREKFLLAQCYLLIGEFEKACELLESALKSGSDEGKRYTQDTERRRTPFNTLQAAYWRLQDPVNGLRVLRRLREIPGGDDELGIWNSALEEIHFEGLISNPRGAVVRFMNSDNAHSHLHKKAPRLYAVTRLLLADLQARAGDSASALKSFAEADRSYIEDQLDYQPLSRIQVLWLKARSDIATEAELAFLAQYPGKPPFCCTPASERYRKEPERWYALNPRPSKVTYDIDLHVGEWRSPKGLHSHLPLELKLLALLWLARDYGVHRYLLQALLWPDHWMVQSALDDRLSKLIERLRGDTYYLDIEVRDECVFLSKSHWRKVFVDPFVERPRRLLELTGGVKKAALGTRLFNWENLLEGYGLGGTQARAVLNDWIERGWIERVGTGRATRYRITKPGLLND